MPFIPSDLVSSDVVTEAVRLFNEYLAARAKSVENLERRVVSTRSDQGGDSGDKRGLLAEDLADVLFADERVRFLDYVSGLDPEWQAQLMAMAYLGKMKATPTAYLWSYYVKMAHGMNEGGSLPSLLASDAFHPKHIEACFALFTPPGEPLGPE